MLSYFLSCIKLNTAKMNSPNNPSIKIREGLPSIMKLIVLPKARLPINTITSRVAYFQYSDFKIPKIKILAIPRYKNIMALNIFLRSMASISTSNNLGNTCSGYSPYSKDAGIKIAADRIRCAFFLFKYVFIKLFFRLKRIERSL